MGQLALTFRGPFVYVIEASSVDVYAPKCANHHAGIFTVNVEYPICGCSRNGGTYTYTLAMTGVDNNVGAISYPAKSTWFVDAPVGTTPDLSKVSFCINVPRPQTILPIGPAKTEIVKDNIPKGQLDQFATGMRFYYNSSDLTKAVIELMTPKPDNQPLPLTLDDLPSLPSYADIDINYADPGADDAEHSDAISCFENTMNVLGLGWWLFYGQGDKGMLARTGADCKSLAVFVGR
jgi:hypothetical protein